MTLLGAVKTRFYDEWEELGEAERRRAVSARLDDYVAFARGTVPFYRERLKKYSGKAEHPLAGVPVLTSEDLRERLPPKNAGLLSAPGSSYSVFQSGGTTGSPKTSLFTHEELDLLTLPNARGFYALGLRESDRVANLFAVGGLYMTFVHINRFLQESGCMNFPFSNHTEPEFFRSVVKLFGINCVAGITSVALSALRDMDRAEPGAVKIEKIFFGGERLYESDREELRRKFGAKVIAAPGYGTVDTWYIGYQCLACPDRVFHAHDDQCYIEIVDEESGRHCAPGEDGMLYATPFPRRLTPIIRYRVGDRAKWLPGKCSCGRTTPLFALLERGDEVLRIGYDFVDYAHVQACAALVKGLSGTVQMEKKRESGLDRLVLRVETEAATAGYPALASALAEKLLKERPTLSQAVKKGSVLPLSVELLAPGSIPRNPRTGKLPRVIDLP